MKSLETAIKVVGSPSKLADLLKVSPQVVCNWRRRGQPSPAKCKEIEAATGGTVTAASLRPDIFGPAKREVA